MTDLITQDDASVPAPLSDFGPLTFAQRVAMDPTIDVARLKEIIAMERESQRHAAEQAFARAMAVMQPQLPAIEKQGDNAHLRAKYAKLEDIQSAVRPLLAAHGFAVRWTSETIDGKIHVTCIVTHRDGHSERDTLPLPVLTDQKGVNALQQHGITMSYGKRYTLCNVLGIQLGGEDTDGSTDGVETVGPEQMTELDVLLRRWDGDRRSFFEFLGVAGMADIPASRFEFVRTTLLKKVEKAEAARAAAAAKQEPAQ